MNLVNYLTTAEFQALNPDLDISSYPDATISGMIAVASDVMDSYLQYSLVEETIASEKNECVITNQGNLMIYTAKAPITAVSAISLKLGTVNLQLTLTDGAGNPRYDIPSRGKYVLYPYQEISMTGTFSVRNFLQLRNREIFSVITYTAGYPLSQLPKDLKLACALLTRDQVVREKSNPSGASSWSQGGISMGYANIFDDSGASVFVKQARAILQSYRRMTA